MKNKKRFKKYGYRRDQEARLRAVGYEQEDSLATEAANQMRHLKTALTELIEAVELSDSSEIKTKLKAAKKTINI